MNRIATQARLSTKTVFHIQIIVSMNIYHSFTLWILN